MDGLDAVTVFATVDFIVVAVDANEATTSK